MWSFVSIIHDLPKSVFKIDLKKVIDEEKHGITPLCSYTYQVVFKWISNLNNIYLEAYSLNKRNMNINEELKFSEIQ